MTLILKTLGKHRSHYSTWKIRIPGLIRQLGLMFLQRHGFSNGSQGTQFNGLE